VSFRYLISVLEIFDRCPGDNLDISLRYFISFIVIFQSSMRYFIRFLEIFHRVPGDIPLASI